MGLKKGVANMLDFIAMRSLLNSKAKMQTQSKEQEEINRLMRDLREYNVWTNPDDPARRLWEKQNPGVVLPMMNKKTTPEMLMRLKNPGLGIGGGGFNIFGNEGDGVVNVNE